MSERRNNRSTLERRFLVAGLASSVVLPLARAQAPRPLATTPELQRVLGTVRAHVPLRRQDHRLDRDIDKLSRLVRDGACSQFLD